MREHAPEFHVSETLLTHEAPENAYAIVRRLIAEEPELRGISVNGGGISGVLRAMRELAVEQQCKIRLVCRDIGPEARKGLSEGLITASLCHPVDRMPEELINVMLRMSARAMAMARCDFPLRATNQHAIGQMPLRASHRRAAANKKERK
ncbi:hypothetical protein [Mesorhizobium sp. L-2-11]|uniref:hypothetical protein n=1 Tax=Mesorhizobium sp. L-2-11 TaxID=2744521 RepID=UPI001FD53240|nr:hypothetical protein [Mesorhizobium sp. L-2-11]